MSTPHLRWLLPVSILLTALPVGCGLSFDREEIRLRVRPDQDRVEALMIYHGAAPSDGSKQAFEESVTTAGAVIAGARVFPLLGPLVFNLDEPGEDLTPEQAELRSCIRVDRSGAFLDEGHLCLYQKAHVERLGFVIEALNRTISQVLIARAAEQAKAPEKNADGLDPRTLELWLAKARRGEPWIRVRGGAIELDIPLSAEGRNLGLKSLLVGLSASPDREQMVDLLVQITRTLDSITYEEERLIARFGGARGNLLDIVLKSDPEKERESDGPLLEALAGAGHRPDPEMTLTEVRSLLAGPN